MPQKKSFEDWLKLKSYERKKGLALYGSQLVITVLLADVLLCEPKMPCSR